MGFQEILAELPRILGQQNHLQRVGDVIDAQNRFRGMRTNPFNEMGEPASGGGRGYNPITARPPDAEQTSFGAPDIGLRNTLEIGRFGRSLTDFERAQLQSNQDTMNLLRTYRGPGFNGEQQ